MVSRHKHSVESREHVENENIIDKNIGRVQKLPDGDRRLTLIEITHQVVKIYGGIFSIIISELGIRKVCARLVPFSYDP